MSDMISRDEVLAILADLKKDYPTHSVPDAEAKVALRKVADKIRAIEVVRGEWMPNPKIGWGETWVCSICGEKTTSSVMGYPRYNYCPMCGAKMDGERKGE